MMRRVISCDPSFTVGSKFGAGVSALTAPVSAAVPAMAADWARKSRRVVSFMMAPAGGYATSSPEVPLFVQRKYEVVTDRHDREIDQRVADPRWVNALESMILIGPDRPTDGNGQRKRHGGGPEPTGEETAEHQDVVRREPQARNGNRGRQR